MPAEMTPPEPPASERTWAARYAKGRQAEQTRREFWDDFDSGWVMVAELVAAVLTWGGIGWLLDRWLGIGPWLMSVGFLVGFATGFYLIWARSSGVITRPTTTERGARDDTR